MDSSAAIQAIHLDLSFDLPPMNSVFRVSQQAGNPALPEPVQRMVRLFERELTVQEICQFLEIPTFKGMAVVNKLMAMGIIDVAGVHEDPGFDSLEEAFFASAVPVIDECDLPFETVGQKMRRFLLRVLSGGKQ